MLCCIGLAQAQVKKQKLRVLYVGGATDQYPDMYKNDEAAMQADVKARTAAFEALLSAYFTEVKVMDAADYVQDCSKGYDVTIMDGRPKQTLRPAVRDRVKQAYAPAAYFTEDFDLPVLAIGSASESIGRSVGLKNDWYCLCLDADAHHWDAHHPIFNGPFKTTITEVEKPTPADAFHYEYYLLVAQDHQDVGGTDQRLHDPQRICRGHGISSVGLSRLARYGSDFERRMRQDHRRGGHWPSRQLLPLGLCRFASLYDR